MSRGINRVTLIGNCCADPAIKHLPSGGAVTNITVATNEAWKDKNGEKQERAEFHRVVLFGKTAEIAGEYLKKGRMVYIEGRLQTRKYQDKEGVERYSTEIVASDMQMLGGGEGGRGGEPVWGGDRPKAAQASAPAADFDDDVPW